MIDLTIINEGKKDLYEGDYRGELNKIIKVLAQKITQNEIDFIHKKVSYEDYVATEERLRLQINPLLIVKDNVRHSNIERYLPNEDIISTNPAVMKYDEEQRNKGKVM